MPLLRRQPFVKQKQPPNLKANDEVFYCKMTGEIFTDYEKFFERIILCNSLVWTCESTGHPGLTYQEAVDSEERVRKQLLSFPMALQKALIFLANRTHRSRINDMSDDVYSYVKERYFVGEMLEVQYKSGEKKTCKLIKAMAPTKKCVNPPVITIDPSSDSDSDVVCLDDPPKPQSPKSPKVTDSKSAADLCPLDYEYVVQELKKPNIFVVKPSQLNRKRGLFTREKNKLYLKQHCHSEGDGVWKVKDKMIRKFKLKEITFDMMFDGPPPTFQVSHAKKKPRSVSSPISGLGREDEAIQKAKKEMKEKKKAEKLEKKAQKRREKNEALKQEKEAKLAEEMQKSMSPEERIAIREKLKAEKLAEKLVKKEEMKKKMEEERQRKKEERDKEKEKKREEKLVRDQCLKEWSRPREDLECDDLKDLPIPKPVTCQIPGEIFGDAIMVLEYLHCFGSLMDLKSVFPNGISIADLGRALSETEVTGVYSDLVQLLLSSIFQLQEEEQEEEQEMENNTKGAWGFEQSENVSYQKLVKNATIAAQWPQLKYGCSLKQLSMDGFNLTEILRLHFLSSGADISASNARFNYQQRGGFTSLDDAGLEFRKKETTVIRALSECNLFDLDPESKLKILMALINQLLTFVAERDFLEDNAEQLKACRIELRELQLSEKRREKDEATFWWRKRVEKRAKEKEIEAERKAQEKKEKEDQLRQEESGVKPESSPKSKEEQKPEPERKSVRQRELADMRDLKSVMDLPTENIDWEKVTPAERERIKELYQRKEAELLQLAEEVQHATAIYPLGRDRTFRRYWMFRSIPGLFVEDQEDHVDEGYMQPAPQTGKSNPFLSCNLPLDEKRASREEKSTSSDKENDSFDHGKDGEIDVVISDSKQDVKPLKGLSDNAMNVQSKESDMEIQEEKDIVLCQSVHDQIKESRSVCWSYIHTVEQLDKLISGLNPRGLREGALKSVLQEQKMVIVESLRACPSNLLSVSKDSLDKGVDKGVRVQSIKSRNTNKTMQGVVRNASAQELIELNLREALLDFEERIYVGSLGALKVKDRTKWRDAIEAGSYNALSEDVPWETSETSLNISRTAEDSDDEDDADATPVVRDMGRALVQIANALDNKYLDAPLGGENRKNKKKGQTSRISNGTKHKDNEVPLDNDSDDGSSAEGSVMTARERWQQSLLTVTSLPQIFLHLATLESSITWSKSSLHTRCRICRRKSDGEHMLLCDGCDRGHHMYCLKPPVKNVPKGDWYCPTCRPKDVVRTPRKRRKSIFEEEEVEEAETEEQEDSSDEEQKDSDEEVADSDNEDGDDEDSDADSSDSDDDDSDSDDDSDEEEEEDVPPQPAKIKFLKNVKKRQPSSGRSTPTEAPSRGRSQGKDKGGKSSRAASTEPVSRSRQSLEKAKEPPRPSAKRSLDLGVKASAKVSRKSLETDAGQAARSRRSTDPAARHSLGASASKRKRDDNEGETSTGKRPTLTKSSSRSGLKVESLKQAEDLVAEISARSEAWPFLAPITRRDAPDYMDIIKKPMDLATIKSKINSYVYVHLSELLTDVRLIFANCLQYNMPQASEYIAGQKLSRYFEKRTKELKLDEAACKPSPQKRSQSNSPPKRSRRN